MSEEVRGKEDERGKIPSFETIDFLDLEKKIKDNMDKYIVIADMTGKAHSFMSYNYNIHETADDNRRVVIKKDMTIPEVTEKLRGKLVNVINVGKILVYHMKQQVPPVKDKYDTLSTGLKMSSDVFAKTKTDFLKWCWDNKGKIVKPDEDKGVDGAAG